MKIWLVTAVAFVSFSAAAIAQEVTQSAPLLPLDSMSCEEMQAELTVAGQRMNAQMDPEFAAEAQRMQQESQQGQNSVAGSIAAGVGMGLACSIPGVGMACMAAQQAQAARAQHQAGQNMERMDAQMDRLNASMEGIDQERMMAVSQRYEEQNCQAPQ